MSKNNSPPKQQPKTKILMLKITATQYQQLNQSTQTLFQQRLSLHLKDTWGTAFSDSEYDEFSRLAIEKCHQYQIVGQKDVTYVAQRMLTEGLAFDQQNPMVNQVLNDMTIPGEQKIYTIYKYEVAATLQPATVNEGDQSQ